MLEQGRLESDLVPSPVDYAVLRSGGEPADGAELPLLLWLHGGGGSARFLESCRPQFAACWQDKSLPEMAVATPSAGWSFYLDRVDGSEKWETFLLDEFIPHLRAETEAEGPLLVGGISIGAVAALRLAFKHPDRFEAVMAVEPTMEASLDADRVTRRDQVHLPAKIRAQLFGDPLDVSFWEDNHPPVLAGRNATAIAASGLAIYLECGDGDQFHAHYGTELLHRELFDLGLSHEYRQVRGANHVGPSVGGRVSDALRFAGRVLGSDDATSFESIVELETFATRVRELEERAGYRRSRSVDVGDASITVLVQGDGPKIVMLPSLGRGAEDFEDLSDRLAREGYQVLRPQPRGVGGTSAVLVDLTMDRFADDVAAVIASFGGSAAVIGHDFGAQIGQVLAARYPDLVSSLVLLAPPGPVAAASEPATALRRIFIPELSAEEHLEAVALALFAEGNDPVVWVGGWHLQTAFAQAEAERHIEPEQLWAKLQHPVLLLQPEFDRIVPPDNARRMSSAQPDLVTLVDVPQAGHALLPEQPAAVAASILSWFGARR
ncbi:MAG: alpha/beta fold hydrolase [Actinomycetota bacterium]